VLGISQNTVDIFVKHNAKRLGGIDLDTTNQKQMRQSSDQKPIQQILRSLASNEYLDLEELGKLPSNL